MRKGDSEEVRLRPQIFLNLARTETTLANMPQVQPTFSAKFPAVEPRTAPQLFIFEYLQ